MSVDPFSRRQFLTFLAGSPLFAAAGVDFRGLYRLFEGSSRDQSRAFNLMQEATQEPALITAARDALNVFDFEPVAQKNVPVAHWGYLMTGSDDDATVRANREGFDRWELRMRRLVDASKVDPSVEMFGTKWGTPIVVNPVGSQRAFHPEGELAVARAAKANGHLQVLSTMATTSIEEVVTARGAPVWFQLYHRRDWNQTKQMVRRAERAGCPAVVLTVDVIGGNNHETLMRAERNDTRWCVRCHGRWREVDRERRKPMLSELTKGEPILEIGTPTWDFVNRLRDATTMKVFIKGIVTREDAELAMQHGVNGLFVSNHGGRAENSLRATITCVPEVVAAVRGRAPVIVDGGVRRGTDIFKALALGATATGIGRPYIWGLASFGQEGVEAVLSLLRRELELVMRQAGTMSVKQITRNHVTARA